MRTLARLALMTVTAVACGCGGPDDADTTQGVSPVDEGQIAISVGALGSFTEIDFKDIASARYDLVISYLGDDGEWIQLVSEVGIHSLAPGGGMTYVAPCQTYPDGSDRPGQVTVTITGVFDADALALEDAQLPPSQSQQFMCKLQRDVLVPFHFTVVRSANRGFTDISIDIDDVFCSAKFDCVESLLRDEAGEPGPTLVTGLVCQGRSTDSALTFFWDLTCFDDDGIPQQPDTLREVYTGFEDAGGQAFHNTATLLTPALMSGFSHCRYRASGLPAAREGQTRDALFRQGSGYVTWDLTITTDPDTGGLSCEGEVGIDYLDSRADHAATPRDATVAPTREAPLEQRILTVKTAPRMVPSCASQQANAVTSKLAMGDSTAAISDLEQQSAELVEALAARQAAATSVTSAAAALATARAAAGDDANANAVYAGLQSALQQTAAVDSDIVDTAAALEAIRVLVDDADANSFDAAHYDVADTSNAALAGVIAEKVAAGTASVAVVEGQVAAEQAKYAESVVNHSLFVDSMTSCHEGQRERTGVGYAYLNSKFPWVQGALLNPIVDQGWFQVFDAAGRLRDSEALSACAFGGPEHIERVVLQVRAWDLLDSDGERGFIHLIREQPPFVGFYCISGEVEGSCELFPITDIPCGIGPDIPYDNAGGYVIGDGAGSEQPAGAPGP